MSQGSHLNGAWDINRQMENLSVGGINMSEAEWISSALYYTVSEKRPLTPQDFIGAPDKMAVLRATIALGFHLPEVNLGDLHRVVSHRGVHGSFWGFYLHFKDSPCLSVNIVMKATRLFEEHSATFRTKHVPFAERRMWKREHHLAYFLLDCWFLIEYECKFNGILSWNNNTRLQFIFGVLGLFIRLAETGIIKPSFERLIRNDRAHQEHFAKFNKEIFSYKSNFDVVPFVEQLEKHDYEGHVSYFEGFFEILGTNDWNREGADKRYGFAAEPGPRSRYSTFCDPDEDSETSEGEEDTDMF
ncbi:hypothetical protein SLS62_001666 [Diatrype stigma]|uniref:Uncharacterized protein n=1 Tax=Diatrype stigma TaxID=117547 RepID=A0AAN9YWH9_9PEZI